jgi:hypothetical protein
LARLCMTIWSSVALSPVQGCPHVRYRPRTKKSLPGPSHRLASWSPEARPWESRRSRTLGVPLPRGGMCLSADWESAGMTISRQEGRDGPEANSQDAFGDRVVGVVFYTVSVWHNRILSSGRGRTTTSEWTLTATGSSTVTAKGCTGFPCPRPAGMGGLASLSRRKLILPPCFPCPYIPAGAQQ